MSVTEMRLRETMEIIENVQAYRMVEKGSSKGDLAMVARKECKVVCEIMDVSYSDMSEDITIARRVFNSG